MNYEERYKKALERARDVYTYYCDDREQLRKIESIFPELSNGEDERIRKVLLNDFKNNCSEYYCEGVNRDMIIAWLEKQGEQKTADKDKQNFKVGNWIVFNGLVLYIYEIMDGYYKTVDIDGIPCSYDLAIDNIARLWTIADTKDGDVLACNEEILLFKSYSIQGRISLYCWYNGQTNNFHSKEVVDTLLTTRNKICPATKEQRDLLFAKMHDAGYEWDAKKKQLKKIEPKTLNADKVIEWIRENIPIYGNYVMIDRFKKDFDL